MRSGRLCLRRPLGHPAPRRTGRERFGKPSNPAFLLRPHELLEAFQGPLTVVAFEQGVLSQPRPAVVQRLAAVRSDTLPPLP